VGIATGATCLATIGASFLITFGTIAGLITGFGIIIGLALPTGATIGLIGFLAGA
jgi:hypothetical protein